MELLVFGLLFDFIHFFQDYLHYNSISITTPLPHIPICKNVGHEILHQPVDQECVTHQPQTPFVDPQNGCQCSILTQCLGHRRFRNLYYSIMEINLDKIFTLQMFFKPQIHPPNQPLMLTIQKK